jgi:hypothetical protein
MASFPSSRTMDSTYTRTMSSIAVSTMIASPTSPKPKHERGDTPPLPNSFTWEGVSWCPSFLPIDFSDHFDDCQNLQIKNCNLSLKDNPNTSDILRKAFGKWENLETIRFSCCTGVDELIPLLLECKNLNLVEIQEQEEGDDLGNTYFYSKHVLSSGDTYVEEAPLRFSALVESGKILCIRGKLLY